MAAHRRHHQPKEEFSIKLPVTVSDLDSEGEAINSYEYTLDVTVWARDHEEAARKLSRALTRICT